MNRSVSNGFGGARAGRLAASATTEPSSAMPAAGCGARGAPGAARKTTRGVSAS
jgi:hypothetical protein